MKKMILPLLAAFAALSMPGRPETKAQTHGERMAADFAGRRNH